MSTKSLIIIILDESGSMHSKRAHVLGGFNHLIRDQKSGQSSDRTTLTRVKFNTLVSVVHNGVPLQDIPELHLNTYTPGGGTALFDAIAEAVRLADRDKASDERVVCVVITDGEENSSKETTQQQMKDIITGHESRGDWTFVYIPSDGPDGAVRLSGMSCNTTTL